ncbi:MAG: hypothetical protein M0R70_00865 [Nitrospirae bacterium]|nr:hypothetical protein [Nitrospirota bacterium]
MKKTSFIILLLLVTSALLFSACGGGGGGGTTEGNTTGGNTTTQSTQAIVKLSATGTLATGTQIGGIDITMHLPAGVTIKSTTNPPETDSGIVTASGLAVSNSSVVANYTASSGTVHIVLANPNGFSTGEFATVNCDIAAGSNPTQTDFSVVNMTAKDLNGIAISGLSAVLTADIH